MNTSVMGAVRDYLDARSNLRFKTLKEYRHRLTRFAAWCEAKNLGLDAIKPAVVKQFIDAQNASISVQASYARVIKGFLNWCSKEEDYEEVVPERTAKKILQPKREVTEVEIFTSEEVKRLFVACDEEKDEERRARNKAILAVLLDTGVRASELCYDTSRKNETGRIIEDTGLKLEHVYLNDPQDPRIRVHGKGNKWREVGLGRVARRHIRTYLKLRTPTHEPHLFLGRGDHSLTVRGLESILDEIGERARVEDCHPHKFRHTFAYMYLLGGGDIYILSRLMGHTGVEVTQQYLRGIRDRQTRQGPSVLDNIEGV